MNKKLTLLSSCLGENGLIFHSQPGLNFDDKWLFLLVAIILLQFLLRYWTKQCSLPSLLLSPGLGENGLILHSQPGLYMLLPAGGGAC